MPLAASKPGRSRRRHRMVGAQARGGRRIKEPASTSWAVSRATGAVKRASGALLACTLSYSLVHALCSTCASCGGASSYQVTLWGPLVEAAWVPLGAPAIYFPVLRRATRDDDRRNF